MLPLILIGENELELAKERLRQFDIVFLIEWMHDETQIDALTGLFPHEGLSALHQVKGNPNAKKRLGDKLLSPSEVNLYATTINL